MGFETDKYLVSRENKEVVLDLDGEEIRIKVRNIPWSKKNELISRNLTWNSSGTASFDADGYLRETLKYMIVEAPWGQTTDTFLSQVGDKLGAALEALAPKAFSSNLKVGVEETKKELPPS